MAYIQGEARGQTSMFPVTLDELIPSDHVCRVIEAFVERLNMAELGFVRAEPAETGRPGYDPRDLLKLYLYGYMQQARSSRRLEAECCRNVEVMWLLGRLQPDYKSIAEFRRMHCQAVTEVGARLVAFARSVGLVKGEMVAIDGSKFRAVSSANTVREREAMKRYLEQMDASDEQDEVVIDPAAVEAALETLKNDPEPEARLMPMQKQFAPAYNVQTAVDAEHALIVAHKVTDVTGDKSHLLHMAEAAKEALGNPDLLHVVADAGYGNAVQGKACETIGILPHVPVARTVNNQGDGTLYDRSQFDYDKKSNSFRCPANQVLTRKAISRKDHAVIYAASPDICGKCPLKSRCTQTSHRRLTRHLYEDVIERMQRRATPEMMRLRKSTVEHPFASLKYWIFGHPRFLLRGLKGAQTEISLAAMAYNLKRMLKVAGGESLTAALI